MNFPRTLNRFFHPSILQLLAFRMSGAARRIAGAFRSRRKIWLLLLGVALSFVWLGQTVLAIFLRQPANPEQLGTWLSVSMLLYCMFHMIKIGCRTPTEPFEWTEAEKQWLLAGPLTRSHLVTSRLISYFAATAAKSFCFAIVMLPDLNLLLAGYSGMFIGLTLIDLFRILLERVAWVAEKSSRKTWLAIRSAMIVPVLALLGLAFVQMAWSPEFEAATHSPNPMSIPQLFLACVSQVFASPPFSWLMIPWMAVSDTILTAQYDIAFFCRIGMLYLAASALSATVFHADKVGEVWLRRLELTRKYSPKQANNKACASSKFSSRVPVGMGGAKAIIWHHALGAFHYRASLAMSLLIPTLLSCIPLLSGDNGMLSSLSILGSIVFYSFLLLPAALMLDYRRDANRLALWKAAPVKSFAMTLGQLAIPVALMSLFQLFVLLIAVFVGGHPYPMLLAWPVLIPLNVLIIGMENAIFLAHPYRRNQEGFEVFLRTILTFTGKGLLFAIGLALVLLWAWVSILFGRFFETPSFSAPVFVAGMLVALSMLAWMSIQVCSRLFEKLDVSFDLPPA